MPSSRSRHCWNAHGPRSAPDGWQMPGTSRHGRAPCPAARALRSRPQDRIARAADHRPHDAPRRLPRGAP